MITYTKMQGVGNAFVVMDEGVASTGELANLAMRLCADHFGVGADGLLTVGPGRDGASFHFRMFNPDGTEDMCGNGIRCACLYWIRNVGAESVPAVFDVSTKDGHVKCQVLETSHSLKEALVSVDLGVPKTAAADVPIGPTVPDPAHFEIDAQGELLSAAAINTGSTHTVIFLDCEPDEDLFQSVSPVLEVNSMFPERTSILWTWPVGDLAYRVRIWERGVGETLGCGTGAAAVAAIMTARRPELMGKDIKVESRGGVLHGRVDKQTKRVALTGPAVHVYSGVTS
jgi:diaminopimelate epimerase